MARLYADEDFDFPVVVELRGLGHDVLTVHEAGQVGRGISDPDVLAFATARDRAVVTFIRQDFIKLHRTTAVHSGIVVCTRDPVISALATRIHQAIGSHPILANQLIRVIRPQSP